MYELWYLHLSRKTYLRFQFMTRWRYCAVSLVVQLILHYCCHWPCDFSICPVSFTWSPSFSTFGSTLTECRVILFLCYFKSGAQYFGGLLLFMLQNGWTPKSTALCQLAPSLSTCILGNNATTVLLCSMPAIHCMSSYCWYLSSALGEVCILYPNHLSLHITNT